MYAPTPRRRCTSSPSPSASRPPPTTNINGRHHHLGRAWDALFVVGTALDTWTASPRASRSALSWLQGEARSTALTPASSIQARNTAPIVNSFRSYASDAKASPTEVTSILEQRIRGVQEESGLAETGRVLSVGYGIIILGTTTTDIMD